MSDLVGAGNRETVNVTHNHIVPNLLHLAVQSVRQQQQAESGGEGPPANGPAGLGTALPKLSRKGSNSSSKQDHGVSQMCKELTSLLQADDECRVYMRESKSLASLASLLSQVGFGIGSQSIHRLPTWANRQSNHTVKFKLKPT